jgi:pimeloyl-ACP methyl ester carboxylesterase
MAVFERASSIVWVATFLTAVACTAQDDAVTRLPEDGGAGVDSAGAGVDAGREDSGPELDGRHPAADVEAPAVLFRPCVLSSADRTVAAGCALAEVPLHHDDPNGPTLSLYVERILASGASDAQVWLVEGGPGMPGTALQQLAVTLHGALPNVDVYITDHRGAGLSTRFDCPTAIARNAGGDPLPDCGSELRTKWGDDTSAFSTTEAAWDLVELIAGTRKPSQTIFLFGRSYGAYVVNRVLQVAPDLATGVVFDGGFPAAAETTILDSAARPAEAGTRLLEACGSDPDCAAHLGADPAAQAKKALDSVSKCSALTGLGWNRELVQGLLSIALESEELRGLIPAAFYRVGRCAQADATWFDRYATTVLASGKAEDTGSPRQKSLAVFAHVMLSELVGDAVQPNQLDSAGADAVFSLAHELRPYNDAFSGWPRYARDPWMREWATTRAPRLILHGGMDPRVPLSAAGAVKAHAGPGIVQFVELPRATHLTVGTAANQDADCGVAMMVQFLKAPSEPVDTSCATAVQPLTFTADPSLLAALSPAGSVWD